MSFLYCPFCSFLLKRTMGSNSTVEFFLCKTEYNTKLFFIFTPQNETPLKPSEIVHKLRTAFKYTIAKHLYALLYLIICVYFILNFKFSKV